MARSVKLGWFYTVLALIAVLGGGAIFMLGREDGDLSLPQVDMTSLADDGFQGYVLGSDSAPVEITEFSDFQCPFCAQFAVLTMPDVRERLIRAGRVRWRFRDFPLESHQHSRVAHHAAACAAEQGRFWEMHDQLFFNQSNWARKRRVESEFRDFAKRIGLDMSKYNACMKSGRYAARIQAGVNAGLAMGVNSTPTFFIGKRRISGAMAYDNLKALVDSLAPESK